MDVTTLSIVGAILIISLLFLCSRKKWFRKNRASRDAQPGRQSQNQANDNAIAQLGSIHKKARHSGLEVVSYYFLVTMSFTERRMIRAKASELKLGQLFAYDIETKKLALFNVDEFHEYKQTANRTSLTIVAIKE